MTIARGLYTRFERLIHEAAKFGVVGLIGFVVTEIGYYVLHYPLSMGPLTAVTIATVAIIINIIECRLRALMVVMVQPIAACRRSWWSRPPSR